MTEITRAQRAWFAAVGLFALWVGLWGTFQPTQVDRALPWLVPPLHARFLGAVYLSAAVLLAGGLVARRQAEVRVMTLLVTLWTGMLFVLSLFYLHEFDFAHKPVWFWFGAYLAYPLIGIWLLWRHRAPSDAPSEPRLPRWARGYLLAQGAGFVALSLVLLLTPGFMATLWPWKLSRLLAQIYAAPFLAYGLSSLCLGRAGSWPRARIIVRGALVFASAVLVASLIHRGLFVPARIATWVWFLGFGLAVALLGLMQVRCPRQGGRP